MKTGMSKSAQALKSSGKGMDNKMPRWMKHKLDRQPHKRRRWLERREIDEVVYG